MTKVSNVVCPPQLKLLICAYWSTPLKDIPVAEQVGQLKGVATSAIDDQKVSATVEPEVQPRKSNSCSVPAQLDAPVVEKYPGAQLAQLETIAEAEKYPAAQLTQPNEFTR